MRSRTDGPELYTTALYVIEILSVCRTRVKTAKYIVEHFSPTGSPTVQVFRYQTLLRILSGGGQ